ncbi:signal peptidase I [Pelagibius sp. CAU 1746]|uniref:signal peptidase I n=1 Tax=Pelagibius sp. CAU 1746 TaxID=3140370 RepID=UPI00325A7194
METLRTVVIAVLIAVGVRTFAYEPFNIPSGSMEPTLLVGDYLFVSKLSYGYSRHSLPFGLPLFKGRIFSSEPERGDVAVFAYPKDDKTDYIKRIVGLPGDKVEVRGGILYINDVAAKRELLSASEIADLRYYNPSGRLYYETLPNGRRHLIQELGDGYALDDFKPVVVKPGHFFAMGDNRDNSQDSRVPGVGQVPMENLVGRADVLFFSHDGASPWWQVWTWPSTIRFGRIGDGIE